MTIDEICELIEEGFSLYTISLEKEIKYGDLYRICHSTVENYEKYKEARKIYIERMADMTELRFNTSTTAAANTYLNALKVLRPEVYSKNNDETFQVDDIEIEL